MPDPAAISKMDFEAVRCLDASLAEKLKAYAQLHREHQPEVAAIYQDLIDRLTAAGAGKTAPQIGDHLETFALPDTHGRMTSLYDCLERGPLVLSFNRGSWCPFCRLELLTYAERYDEVRGLGANIVSILPEIAKPARSMKETYELPFAVLSDIDNGYALANGLMISCGQELKAVLLERGIDLATLHANNGMFLPITATYVIGQDAVIRDAFVNPDFRIRMPPEQAIAALN